MALYVRPKDEAKSMVLKVFIVPWFTLIDDLLLAAFFEYSTLVITFKPLEHYARCCFQYVRDTRSSV